MNWYKRCQSVPAMGPIGPSRQTTGLFGPDDIDDADPHKNKINLHLNRAARELSSALQEPDIVYTRKRVRKAIEHISRAQRRIDFAI